MPRPPRIKVPSGCGRKNDPAKLAIATRLRNETTLTMREISHRLHLGTTNSAKTNLHRYAHDTVRSNQPRSWIKSSLKYERITSLPSDPPHEKRETPHLLG